MAMRRDTHPSPAGSEVQDRAHDVVRYWTIATLVQLVVGGALGCVDGPLSRPATVAVMIAIQIVAVTLGIVRVQTP